MGYAHRHYSTYFYAILAPELNRVKLGIAESIHKRIRSLRSSSATILHVHGFIRFSSFDEARDYERWIHRTFKQYHFNYEWFAASSLLMEHLDHLFVTPIDVEPIKMAYSVSGNRLQEKILNLVFSDS